MEWKRKKPLQTSCVRGNLHWKVLHLFSFYYRWINWFYSLNRQSSGVKIKISHVIRFVIWIHYEFPLFHVFFNEECNWARLQSKSLVFEPTQERNETRKTFKVFFCQLFLVRIINWNLCRSVISSFPSFLLIGEKCLGSWTRKKSTYNFQFVNVFFFFSCVSSIRFADKISRNVF